MTRIVLLTKEGCLPCRRVKRILAELAGEMAGVSVAEVDLLSDEGRRLALAHGIAYPPAVFVKGKLLGYGKIREDQLRAAIRSAAATPGC